MAERERERNRREMLEEALKRPGVAAVMEVYAKAAPVVAQPQRSRMVVRFATGGNAS